MSEVRNGERPTDASSSPYAERTDLSNLRWNAGGDDLTGEELLAGQHDGTALDDEIVTDLQRTVSQTIRSAQQVAHSVVARARKREALVRARTDERCSLLVAEAEREATAILHRAAAEAVRRLKDAESGIVDMLAAADRRRDGVLADLQRQAYVLEERISRLRQEHDRLARALDLAEEAVREGREALDREVDPAAGRASPGGVGLTPGNGAGPPTERASAVRRNPTRRWSP